MDTVDVALLEMDGPKQKYVWIFVEVDGSGISSKTFKKFWLPKTAKINYFWYFLPFQVAQTTTIIESFQQMGRNDLVKEQMKKIDWIRKTAQDYSEDFYTKMNVWYISC